VKITKEKIESILKRGIFGAKEKKEVKALKCKGCNTIYHEMESITGICANCYCYRFETVFVNSTK